MLLCQYLFLRDLSLDAVLEAMHERRAFCFIGRRNNMGRRFPWERRV